MIALAQKSSQVMLHMSVAFAVTYGFTGSLAVGGVAAVVEPICNVLLLPLHDKAWTKLRAKLAGKSTRREEAPGKSLSALAAEPHAL